MLKTASFLYYTLLRLYYEGVVYYVGVIHVSFEIQAILLASCFQRWSFYTTLAMHDSNKLRNHHTIPIIFKNTHCYILHILQYA